MFLSGAINVKDRMNERVILVHVYTDQSPHSIMVERFAVVDVAGLGAGTQTLSCLAAASGILSPGEIFRERYI